MYLVTLSLVADSFKCKQCDGTIQEVNLAGDPTIGLEIHMDV